MPSITERFLELVATSMYEKLGVPKSVEGKFYKYVGEGSMSNDVDRFIKNLNSLIPKMIDHGNRARMVIPPSDNVSILQVIFNPFFFFFF